MKIGIGLLWASLILDPIKLGFYPGIVQNAHNLFFSYFLFPGIFIIAGLIFIIVMIDIQKNWARIVFILLVFIGTPFQLFRSINMFGTNPALATYEIFLAMIQICAVFFIYAEDSNNWFSKNEKT